MFDQAVVCQLGSLCIDVEEGPKVFLTISGFNHYRILNYSVLLFYDGTSQVSLRNSELFKSKKLIF